MLKSESTKRCRKRIEGYSEIVEYVSEPDSRGEVFRTEGKCINCKWLITSLVIIIIFGSGISWFLIKDLNSSPLPDQYSTNEDHATKTYESNLTNVSVRSNGTSFTSSIEVPPFSHDRKKRNISNETDSEKISSHSKLSGSFAILIRHYNNFKSAMDDFLSELQKYLKIEVRIPREPKVVEQFADERENTSDFVSLIESDVNVENQTNAYNKSEITERISSTPDRKNIFTGVVSVIDHTETTDFSETPGKNTDVPTFNNTSTSPASQTSLLTETELENIQHHSENNPLDREIKSSTKTTVTRYTTDGGHDSVDNDENTTELITKKEKQSNESPLLSQTSVTQSEFQQEIQISTTQRYFELETHLSSPEVVDTTTKQGNIMKIPARTATSYTELTTTPQPQILTTTTFEDTSIISESATPHPQISTTTTFQDTSIISESAIINENGYFTSEKSSNENPTEQSVEDWSIKQIQQDNRYSLNNGTTDIIQNVTSSVYLLPNIDENLLIKDLLNKLKNLINKELYGARRSRNTGTDQPSTEWHMLCYQKKNKLDGKFDVKFVKIPLNQSEIEKIPKSLNRRTNWPSYSAHSLHTHKQFQQYSTNDQTTSNITEQIDMFTLSSDDDPQGSMYYCTYSQARDANEADEVLESRLRMFLTNSQFNWEALTKEMCSPQERMCADGSECIAAELWCDEVINCKDFSDESNCTCRERINAGKLCDGYFDCPGGEDEQGCFECPEKKFSCDNWKPHKQEYTPTCVSMEKRCDGEIDCLDGKDEKDCELLADDIYFHETFLISYTSGYLHRNWKGKWYPVCGDNLSEFSARACQSEGIQNTRNIEMSSRLIPNHYIGQFIAVYGTHITLTIECFPANTVIHVVCPTEECGSRVKSADTRKYKHRREAIWSPSSVNKTHTLSDDFVRKRREEEGRVVGGQISDPGLWPWIVALYKNGIFHCGAAILDNTWIVTAAHCVEHYRDNYYEVQAGTLRRLSFSPTEQNRRVTHVIIHERYAHSEMKNDIALLRVEPPLKMNRWIRPICLPEARPPWGPQTGELCTAVGWGATHERGPDPDNMREVEVPILPHCKHFSDVQGHEICAGFVQGEHDTCQGDSGGPLLCRIPINQDHWYLAGIVSHGEGCARPMEPGVYTRMAIYLDWIVKNTNDRHCDISQQSLPHCPGMRCFKEGRCISRKQICDDVIDCLNGEDEISANCRSKWISEITDGFRNHREIPSESAYPANGTNTNITMKAYSLKEMKKASEFNVFDDWWQNDVHDFNTNETYVCKIIKQVVPKLWHCDGEVDCEDGTDEINCTCVDILKNMNSSLICNGIADCSDWSDEMNCTKKNSTKDDFLCYQSYSASINRTEVCDGKSDCPNGEDEKYCYALSDEYMNVPSDFFGIPVFRKNGTIMEHKNGTWKPYCSPRQLQDEMLKICRYLGFRKLVDFEKQRIPGMACNSIYVHCSNHDNELNNLPWFGNIYINGFKRCSGLLLTDQWLVADYNCPSYNLQEDYVAVVLGGNRIMENKVQSVHEQVIRIDYGHFDVKQNTTLMHLEKTANTSTHVKPFRTEGEMNWVLSPFKTEVCLMIADLKVPTTVSINVEENCLSKSCSYRPANKTRFCTIYNQNYTLSSLLCFASENYWYLTAPTTKQFHEFCSTNATTFSLLRWADPDIMDDNFQPFVSPNCTTYRCTLGNCLSRTEMCDGKPNCRNNEDETPEVCEQKSTFCSLESFACPCKKYEFRCKNSRCVDRNLICDGKNDCEDGSDEPPECFNFSCATYLNMTEPSKLCDTRVDCWDKSDENPAACSSYCQTKSHFKCPKSGQCIPLEFICDGESDCSDHEDERKCWKLINSEKNPNEPNLFVQKHGEWHKQCLSSDMTSFRPDVVCKESNFNKKRMIQFIPGTKALSNEYTRITLRNEKEFKLKAKPLIQSNLTETCSYIHLKCE